MNLRQLNPRLDMENKKNKRSSKKDNTGAIDLGAVKCGYIPDVRKTEKLSNAQLTIGEKVIRWIESECMVPEGKLVGKPVVLLESQKLFILSTFDNPKGTKRAILSIARKNGKTGLLAPLLLALMAGPAAQKNAQLVSGAMSKEQAAILFQAMAKTIRLNPRLDQRFRIAESQKRLTCITTGCTYRALAKDTSGASTQGLSPYVVVLDEAGQIVGPRDPFVDALTSAQGAHESPLFFVISTQAASDSDWMSMQIDDAIAVSDPHSVVHVYEADKDCDLLDETQWAKANPALDVFRSREDLKTQLERAARMPSAEASARNLLLNQRISLLTLAVSPTVWKTNNGDINHELFYKYPVHIGLDLSARNDLTAAVCSVKDEETGIVHVLPFCFTPLDGLDERARNDRVPYDLWVRQQKLIAIDGKHMDYDQLADELKRLTEGMTIATLQFDRWRIEDFKPRAERAGFANEAEWIACGQGFKDFSLRIEGLDSLLLSNRIRHGNHPLLNMAAANAIVISDPTGSRKFDKAKSSQRIDPIVAMAMSVYPLSDGNVVTLDIGSMIA
jgi:phage terminase large subunit-like protein